MTKLDLLVCMDDVLLQGLRDLQAALMTELDLLACIKRYNHEKCSIIIQN